MNLGKDASHLGLHFNPRFDAHGDVNTIVCNSKKVEEWGAEHRETVFPFQKGGIAEVRPGMHSVPAPVKGGCLAQGIQLAGAVSGLTVQEMAGFSCLASATIQGSEQ